MEGHTCTYNTHTYTENAPIFTVSVGLAQAHSNYEVQMKFHKYVNLAYQNKAKNLDQT